MRNHEYLLFTAFPVREAVPVLANFVSVPAKFVSVFTKSIRFNELRLECALIPADRVSPILPTEQVKGYFIPDSW